MMTRKMWFLASTILLLVTYWAGIVGYWTGEREPPVIIRSMTVVGKAERGDRLLIRYHVTRTRVCQASKLEYVIDSTGLKWLIEQRLLLNMTAPVGDEEFMVSVTLPKDIPVGPAKYQVTFTYICNPTHLIAPVTLVAPPQIFEVVAPE